MTCVRLKKMFALRRHTGPQTQRALRCTREKRKQWARAGMRTEALVQDGAVANPTVDRVFDFSIRVQHFTSVQGAGQQRAVIQTVPPKHGAASFRHDLNAELRENSSSAVFGAEVSEIKRTVNSLFWPLKLGSK